MATKRKSNRIILGLIAYFVLFLLGMQLVLFARYKSGDIETESMLKDFDVESYPGVQMVLISGLAKVHLERSDTLKVEIGKQDAVERVQKGDTLFISAKKSREKVNAPSWIKLHLGLPEHIFIIAKRSILSIAARDSTTQPVSWIISAADSSEVSAEEPRDGDSYIQRFSKLGLFLDHSQAKLSSALSIDSIQLTIIDSKFSENQARFNHITLTADSAAGTNVSLSGQTLQQLIRQRAATSNQ